MLVSWRVILQYKKPGSQMLLILIDWNSFGGLKSQNGRQTHFKYCMHPPGN